MKQSMQWIAALFTVASASLALAGPGSGIYGPFGSEGAYGGFGPYTSCARLEPVGEQIVQRRVIYTQSPMLIRQRSYVMESPSAWNQPSDAVQVVGNVVTAPFRLLGSGLAWTGRTLSGQPLEPVGERFTTVRVIRSQPILEPVGERFTTVRIIRSHTMLKPVGEKVTTVKTTKHYKHGKKLMTKKVTYHTSAMLMPVGERFTTVKVIRSQPLLEPVGERITTVKVIRSQPLLEPVGERTWIRSTRIYSQPSCGCH